MLAPGGEPESGAPDNGQILSTNKGGLYGRGHGTSQAAAHVTGAVALALSAQPGLTTQAVRNSCDADRRGRTNRCQEDDKSIAPIDEKL